MAKGGEGGLGWGLICYLSYHYTPQNAWQSSLIGEYWYEIVHSAQIGSLTSSFSVLILIPRVAHNFRIVALKVAAEVNVTFFASIKVA